MGFPWQEYWSELPFLPPGDLPNPGIKLASPALAGGFFTTEAHIHSWTLSLLPHLGNCKKCCNKFGGADIFWS